MLYIARCVGGYVRAGYARAGYARAEYARARGIRFPVIGLGCLAESIN